MKKSLYVLVMICIVVLSINNIQPVSADAASTWDGKTLTAPAGEGTKDNPYLIANGENLAWLANKVNTNENYDTAVYYAKQTADIFMNDNDVFENKKKTYKEGYGSGTIYATEIADGKAVNAIASIGYYDADNVRPFRGEYDGNGYKIYNLYVANYNEKGTALLPYAGLFGAVEGSVKNVTISSGIISGGEYSGSMVGCLSGSEGECRIVNCINNATVNGGAYSGGLVGKMESITNNVYLLGSTNNGTVVAGQNDSKDSRAGGIVGYIGSGAFVDNCLNTGAVFAKGKYIGGISGEISGTPSITNSLNVSKNYASGAAKYMYGLSGRGPELIGDVVIKNVYSVKWWSSSSEHPVGWRYAGGNMSFSTPGRYICCDGEKEPSEDMIASFDMAYALNGAMRVDGTMMIESEEYSTSGAWTYNDGDLYPKPATEESPGVYKLNVKNGADSDNIWINTDYKSKTGKMVLIIFDGNFAAVNNINLKATNIAVLNAFEGDKIMLWDSLENLRPMAEEYIVTE